MNFLVIGSGAREHIIAQKLFDAGVNVFSVITNRNPGLINLSKEFLFVNTYKANIQKIVDFSLTKYIDCVVIGPEDPLALGFSDSFLSKGIPVVGPTKLLAQIETSKGFTRDLLVRNEIYVSPRYERFNSINGVEDFIKELSDEYVVKYDGLMGGKGVKVSGEHLMSTQEAISYCNQLIDLGGSFIVEEKLLGEEFSLMSFCDGKNIQHMPIVQDHKRAYENDSGPNTGGMGTYSDYNHSLPFLNDADIESAKKINLLTMESLKDKTGMDYIGILYGGFMAVKNGVRLIEYNARFGDPEAMNVLSILKTDFIDICKKMVSSSLDKIKIEFENKATVCKYSVPNGYPDNPVKNQIIDISDIKDKDKLFYASVNIEGDNLIETGSRTLAIISVAETIVDAERSAEDNIKRVKGPVFHRSDIGTK